MVQTKNGYQGSEIDFIGEFNMKAPTRSSQVLRTNQFGSIFGISRFTFHLSEELVKFIMDPKSDVHVNGNDKSGGLSEVHNSNVSGRIEAFNCLAEVSASTHSLFSEDNNDL
ncbi:hypothetical protein OROMI_017760 [Orobanche minor]